jgi:hypothetical protein
MTRVNGTDRVLTGRGRTAGPEAAGPRKVFSSDLGRRLGLC